VVNGEHVYWGLGGHELEAELVFERGEDAIGFLFVLGRLGRSQATRRIQPTQNRLRVKLCGRRVPAIRNQTARDVRFGKFELPAPC
jgi:hypothetical protein